MKNNFIDQIKANIKVEAKRRNKTIAGICRELNVNRNYINQMREATGVYKIIRIAKIISCPPSDLFRNIK